MLHSWTRSIAFIFPFATTGCIFIGNNNPPLQVETSPYSVAYYSTTPWNFQTAATFQNSASNQQNTNVDTSLVPADISNVFTNPTELVTSNTDPTQAPNFIGTGNVQAGIDTAVSGTTVNSQSTSTAATLWTDPNCTTQVILTQTGTLNNGNIGSVSDSAGDTIPLSGRLSLMITVQTTLTGTCDTDLATLAGCYSGGASCTPDAVSAAQNLYGLYVATGVINLSQTSGLQSLTYIVQLE